MSTKNIRWLTVITILLLVVNIITLSFLWLNKKDDHERFSRPQRGQVFDFICKELQLDQQQQEAYRKLRDEHQQATQALRDSIRKTKDDLFALLKQPGVSDSVIQAAAKKANTTEEQLDMLTFRHFQKLRTICTPVQQKKFDDIIQDALHQMAPPPMHGGPPPPEKN